MHGDSRFERSQGEVRTLALRPRPIRRINPALRLAMLIFAVLLVYVCLLRIIASLAHFDDRPPAYPPTNYSDPESGMLMRSVYTQETWPPAYNLRPRYPVPAGKRKIVRKGLAASGRATIGE